MIFFSVQHEVFKKELECLEKGQICPKQSVLKKLNPVVDKGLLLVGGHLSVAEMSKEEKYLPIAQHTHTTTLLVRYYHEQVAYQGQQITEGVIRSAGYWIIGSQRVVFFS